MTRAGYEHLLSSLQHPAPTRFMTWDARHPQWHQLPFDEHAASSRTARVRPDLLELPPGLRASWPFATTHLVSRVLQPLDRRAKVLCSVVAARMMQDWLPLVVTDSGPDPARVADTLAHVERFIDGAAELSRGRRDALMARLISEDQSFVATGGAYSSDQWAFTYGQHRSAVATAAAGSAAGAMDSTAHGAAVAVSLVIDWLPRTLGGLDPREEPFARIAFPLARRLASEWWRRCRARLALRDVWDARLG